LQAIRVVRFLKRSRKLPIKGRYFFPCESRQSPTKGRSEIPQRVVMTNYGYPKRVVEGHHKGPLPRSRETSGRETLENRLSTRFQCRSSAGIARWCTGVPIEVPKTTHKGSLCEELGSRGIHKGSLLGHRGRAECGNARGPSGSKTLAIMTQTLQNDLPLWRHSGWTARATTGCWSTGIRGLLHEQPYCSGIVGARPLRTQRQATLPAGFRTRPPAAIPPTTSWRKSRER